jgi:hypothetical protein
MDKVIFRMWDGTVIALFPEEPSDVHSWYNCYSYQHIGQHGGCDPYMIIQHSRLATPSEYAALKQELEQHYDYVFDVRKRLTSDMDNTRRNNWLESTKGI